MFISKKIFNDSIYFYYIFGMINSSAVYVICINDINKGGGVHIGFIDPKSTTQLYFKSAFDLK